MFAFAIHDALQQKLLLARDRAGEKPLFYRLANGCLQFASELKGLLANPANPRDIDPQAMDCYLGMGNVPGDACLLKGYKKLPPAHALRYDLQSGQAQVWPYWQLPDLASEHGSVDDESLLDELEALLQDSVSAQMTADVPVGILLSGGVHSSLVTAMAVPVGLMRQHPMMSLVFSGGDGRLLSTGVTEAQLAQVFYQEQGVDMSRVPLEGGSRTTRENARQVAALLGPRCQEPWLLVTSAWHMRRAMAEFEAVGCRVTAYPVDFRTTDTTPLVEYSLARSLQLWQTALHEWLGAAVYAVTR